MSRLTQKDDSGNWSLKGLPWKENGIQRRDQNEPMVELRYARNAGQKYYGAIISAGARYGRG